jgi:mRNA interferase RelE/StbE
MLKPNFSRQSEKFLLKLQKGQPKHAKQVALKITELCSDPLPQDSSQLRGYDYKRVNVGEYRIIYTFDEETLFLIFIGKRNDNEVYKLLQH